MLFFSGGSVDSSIELECEKNSIIVHCSNRSNGNCTIQYKMSEDILPPGSIKVIHYSREIKNVELIVYMELTTLQLEFKGKLLLIKYILLMLFFIEVHVYPTFWLHLYDE